MLEKKYKALEMAFGRHFQGLFCICIYRTLSILEEKGLVQFEWNLESSGPARKIYKITDAGIECLSNWVRTLEDYRKAIDVIIEEARSTLKK